ncbi:MAG: hypothetical protein JWN04_585 [Myxococcaceae bacterium]|nr:hypothetical protein [Myxococcaceae bacterium]
MSATYFEPSATSTSPRSICLQGDRGWITIPPLHSAADADDVDLPSRRDRIRSKAPLKGITATMGLMRVSGLACVDDGHRRAWPPRHELTRTVTHRRRRGVCPRGGQSREEVEAAALPGSSG